MSRCRRVLCVVAVAVAVAVCAVVSAWLSTRTEYWRPVVAGLLLGSAVFAVVCLVDDRRGRS